MNHVGKDHRMSLYAYITDAWKTAMKARDPAKDTLAAIRTEVKNKTISLRNGASPGAPVDPADSLVLDVLVKMAKQRRESAAEYEKGGREDLVLKEQGELAVIEGFLPQKLSSEALRDAVRAAIAAVGATSPKDIGCVMKTALEMTKGKADGKDVQAVVRELLV